MNAEKIKRLQREVKEERERVNLVSNTKDCVIEDIRLQLNKKLDDLHKVLESVCKERDSFRG